MKNLEDMGIMPILALISALTSAMILTSVLIPASAQNCGWTGTWDTSYGRMELIQSGNTVIGSYPMGTVKGTIYGTRLIGSWWSEDPSLAPLEDVGEMVLNISGNCGSFDGRAIYGSGRLRGYWNGTRTEEIDLEEASGQLLPAEAGDLGGQIPRALDAGMPSPIDEGDHFLGIVVGGEIRLLQPDMPLGRVRATSIAMQEARPPESGELDLSEYEGRAVMVRGREGGGWIYSATLIDQAGPILTSVVLQLFDRKAAAQGQGFHADEPPILNI